MILNSYRYLINYCGVLIKLKINLNIPNDLIQFNISCTILFEIYTQHIIFIVYIILYLINIFRYIL